MHAVRVAIKYMTPVVLLSDGYLANGSEPWRLPDIASLPKIPVTFAREPVGFQAYKRDVETLARPWAKPGTPGLEHRVGGIEKSENTGHVSYDPLNHERMCHLRAEKVARIAQDIPLAKPAGAQSGKVLILAWGSTSGSIFLHRRSLKSTASLRNVP